MCGLHTLRARQTSYALRVYFLVDKVDKVTERKPRDLIIYLLEKRRVDTQLEDTRRDIETHEINLNRRRVSPCD